MSIKSLTHCGGALNQGRLVAHRETFGTKSEFGEELFSQNQKHVSLVLFFVVGPISKYLSAASKR